MGKLSVLFLLFMCTASCLSLRPPMYYTDARVQAEISSFFQDCLGYFHRAQCMPEVNVELKIVDLDSATLGMCTIYPDNTLKIKIDQSVLNSPIRKLVVYHELMHCVFDIEHYDDDIDIMNKDATYDDVIMKDFNYFLQKAFTRIRLEMFRRMLKK